MHQTLSRTDGPVDSVKAPPLTPLAPHTRRDLDTWEIVDLFRRLEPAERAHVLRVSQQLAAWHAGTRDQN